MRVTSCNNLVTLSPYNCKGFAYDVNGNLTASGDGWTVTYNLLNLPASAVKNAGTDDEQTVKWSYLADGTKMGAWTWVPLDEVVEDEAVEESLDPGLVLRSGGQEEPVIDSLQMRSGYLYTGSFRINWNDSSGPQLESVASVGGRFVMATDPSNSSFTAQQRYFITDHLGSTRVVLNNAGSVLERYDYYPYGEKVPVTVANTGNTDYLYTGKESQNALFGINWYDSGARFQTTDGIFTGIDPLAEKYYHISPYAYCAGNPVNMIDPTGMDLSDYYSLSGKLLKTIDDGNPQKYFLLNNNKKNIDQTIEDGLIVEVPTNEIISMMDEVYSLTESTGKEHGFRVGEKNGVSIIVSGDETSITSKQWEPAVDDLRENVGEYVAYDVHSHPKDNAGATNIPSQTDKDNAVGNKPNYVLGYSVSEVLNYSNSQEKRLYHIRSISVYNKSGQIGKPIDYQLFRRSTIKVNKR